MSPSSKPHSSSSDLTDDGMPPPRPPKGRGRGKGRGRSAGQQKVRRPRIDAAICIILFMQVNGDLGFQTFHRDRLAAESPDRLRGGTLRPVPRSPGSPRGRPRGITKTGLGIPGTSGTCPGYPETGPEPRGTGPTPQVPGSRPGPPQPEGTLLVAKPAPPI